MGGDMGQIYKAQWWTTFSVRLSKPEMLEFNRIMEARNDKTHVSHRMKKAAVIRQLLRNWMLENERSEKPFPPRRIEHRDI